MTDDTASAPDTTPRCVFCNAPWNDEMLRLYDAGTSGAMCACCVIFPDFADAPPEPPQSKEHVALPPELACHACGRVLYRLVAPEALP